MQPTGVIPSRLLSILRGVQIRGSSLICINIAVLRNRYGHPHAETLEKLEEAGCEVWNTAKCGQISIDDGGVEVFLKSEQGRSACKETWNTEGQTDTCGNDSNGSGG